MVWNHEIATFERSDLPSPGEPVNKRPWNHNEKVKWIKENSMKGNTISSNQNRKQGYWKFTNNNRIYWSDSQGITAFHNPSVFYAHRQEMGYNRDWSEITKITRGARMDSNNPFMMRGDEVTTI